MKRLRKGFQTHRYTWIGTATVVLGVFALVIALTIGNSGIGKNEVYGDFAQGGGIRPGDPVQIAGIEVGTVSSTKLDGNHVRIAMRINNDVALTTKTSAEIKLSTLLGRRYIALTPGDGVKLAGDRIPDTSVPYDLQQTIERGTPIIGAINSGSLADSLNALNSQLHDLPGMTRSTLDALTELSQIVTNRQDELTALLTNTDQVTQVIDDQQYQLAMVVGQGRALADKIVTRQQLVQNLLDGVAQLTDAAKQLGVQNQDQFAPLIANLNTVSLGLEKNRDNLRNTLEILPVTGRAVANALGDGPYSNSVLASGLFPDKWLCLAGVLTGCAK